MTTINPQSIPHQSSILWTGATGFFGKSLLRGLQSQPQEPIAWHFLSRDPSAFLKRFPAFHDLPETFWHQGDILSLRMDDYPALTHVVHAAADSTSAEHLNSSQRFAQIVEGTRQVLELAVKKGAKRFLLTSSGGVYGRQPADLMTLPEDFHGIPDPLTTANTYGVAKRVAEHLCALYAEEYGIEIIVARCFAFVGEDLPLDVHFAIGNFIRDALWSEEIIVHGDGTAIRSYLDQRDLVRWLLALLQDGKAGQAYNVGSDQAISIADLAHLVRDIVSPNKAVRILGKRVGNAERNRYVPDISKAQRDLGLNVTVPLSEAILQAANAHRKAAGHSQEP
jgi:UDP-glucuronate decarboxylase